MVNTAAALAEVHALTERLDHAMARIYLRLQPVSHSQSNAAPCIAYWWQVADPAIRQYQLGVVLALGKSFESLTSEPGLRMLLKMMRGSASATGLASLQKILEDGFDAFQKMRGADEF